MVWNDRHSGYSNGFSEKTTVAWQEWDTFKLKQHLIQFDNNNLQYIVGVMYLKPWPGCV